MKKQYSQRQLIKTVSLIILSLGFFVNQQLHALATSAIGESLAVSAAMISEMVAKHLELTNDENQLIAKCLTDTLSLTAKGVFFYNNIAAHENLGPWDWTKRDCLVNGGLALRDLTKLAQHLYEVTNSYTADDETTEKQNEQPKQEITGNESQVSTLRYICKVFIQPALKGLTGIAIAATQNYASSYAGDRARYTATAAHCLAHLIEEYSNLKPGSQMEEALILGLIANSLWLCMEGKAYLAEQEAINGRIYQFGDRCRHCHIAGVFNILSCNHANCVNCLRTSLENRVAQRRNEVFCSNATCQHALTRNEIQNLCQNNPQTMREYDQARYRNPRPRKPVPVRPVPQPAPVPPPGPVPQPAPVQPPVVAPAPLGPVVPLAVAQGDCPICFNHEALQTLSCTHRACAGCLDQYIRTAYGERGVRDFSQVRCIEAGCQTHLTLNEIRACTHDDRALATAYNEALARRVAPPAPNRGADRGADDMTEAERRAIGIHGLRRCPGCHVWTDRDGGCPHMTCRNRGCRTQWCWDCNAAYVFRNGFLGHPRGNNCVRDPVRYEQLHLIHFPHFD